MVSILFFLLLLLLVVDLVVLLVSLVIQAVLAVEVALLGRVQVPAQPIKVVLVVQVSGTVLACKLVVVLVVVLAA
jgi:hypothetical protein